MTYQIKNWDRHFETAESRKYKALKWVAIPNRHDSEGYNVLKDNPKKVEIFCAWCLILQIASKCPQRGILVDSEGRPYTPKRMEKLTGYPESIFELAIKELSDPEIGWIITNLPKSPGKPG